MDDDVVFRSQERIDLFGTNRFKEIQGNVTIEIPFIGGSGTQINDLSPLDDIVIISENLKIEGDYIDSEPAWFPNLKEIGGNVDLFEINLSKTFDQLEIIVGDLDISKCIVLDTDPFVFEKLEKIGGGLFCYQTTLMGFDKLRMTGNISIGETGMTNLDFLSNVETVTGNTFLFFNSIMTDYCGLRLLFSEGNFTGSYTVDCYYPDFFNPSIQDIIDGNCSL